MTGLQRQQGPVKTILSREVSAMVPDKEISEIVTGDAEDRLRTLGLERELGIIIQQMKETLPGLRAIEVTPFFDNPPEPHLMIIAYTDAEWSGDDRSFQRKWDNRLKHTFSPDVAEWFLFSLMSYVEPEE
jgi:hypothetical protein